MNLNLDKFFINSFSFIDISSPEKLLKKESKNFFLGSCFAENLFNYYESHYIDALFSPFGNIYNPLSLAASIKRICTEKLILEDEIFIHKELWRHFDFDSEKSRINKKEYLEKINTAITEAHQYLINADNLILTLGTSFIYRYKKTGAIVNNCHKLPADSFSRENSTVELMLNELLESLNLVKSLNANIKIIVTLSPVRHLRDSATENSLSKARLRCLIDELTQSINNSWYFPAYELMIDQLRDYRWYGEDLAHPSKQAVSYIMERFINSAADTDFQKYIIDIDKLNKNLDHKILNKETNESHKFEKNRIENFQRMAAKYPQMLTLQKRFESYFMESHL
ncbi:MAG: GSCFA domain-containing protein [Spirochaetaceae bacterium]|nr:GSCFA domain-containing protein [Spirochaetaceae bacterium]